MLPCDEIIHSDFLVIGSGIAGLTFAKEAADAGSVIIITKKENTASNSNLAQGGIAAVLGTDDTFELHIQDTLVAGDGLCHEEVVRLLVQEGPAMVRALIAWGAEFTQDQQGQYELGREGGHSRRRIVHARDLTGAEVERALLTATTAHPQVTLLEHQFAVDLVTALVGGAPRCVGAVVVDAVQHRVKQSGLGIQQSVAGIGQL